MTTAQHVEASNPAELRKAYGQFATGVAVLTSECSVPHGMTVNSFTSVSLNPPVISVSLDLASRMNSLIEAECYFGISILNEDQRDLARRFSSRSRGLGPEEFEGVPIASGEYSKVPLLSDAVANFECRAVDSVHVGDHRVVFGEVVNFSTDAKLSPLMFFRGSMRHGLIVDG